MVVAWANAGSIGSGVATGADGWLTALVGGGEGATGGRGVGVHPSPASTASRAQLARGMREVCQRAISNASGGGYGSDLRSVT